MSRTWMFLKAFFTGIVPDLPASVYAERKQSWDKLTLGEQTKLIEAVDRRSRERRSSMFETSTRANYLGVIDAFVAAAGGTILAASDTRGFSEVLIKIGVSMVFFAGCVLVLAIAAKGKVWKTHRKGGFSEADEMLREAVEVKEANQEELEAERDRLFLRLHKRKIMLVVERRAQHAAAVISVIGVMVMIVGMCWR